MTKTFSLVLDDQHMGPCLILAKALGISQSEAIRALLLYSAEHVTPDDVRQYVMPLPRGRKKKVGVDLRELLGPDPTPRNPFDVDGTEDLGVTGPLPMTLSEAKTLLVEHQVADLPIRLMRSPEKGPLVFESLKARHQEGFEKAMSSGVSFRIQDMSAFRAAALRASEGAEFELPPGTVLRTREAIEADLNRLGKQDDMGGAWEKQYRAELAAVDRWDADMVALRAQAAPPASSKDLDGGLSAADLEALLEGI